MTETVINAMTPTPLAEALAAGTLDAAAKAALAPYRGVLTPQHLDAAEQETDALFSQVAIHDLGFLRRIAVRGEDRFRWLSGMVTNIVETLPEGTGAYNLILNAQGRIQGDAYVWRQADQLEIEMEADQVEALLAHLDHFIIMDDVELMPMPEWSAIGLAGPNAEALLTALGLPNPPSDKDADLTFAAGSLDGFTVRVERRYGPVVPRYAIWIPADQVLPVWQRLLEAGAKPVGAAAIEALRIAEGTPAYAIDIQSRDLAQETGQARALSSTKGCYLGQEIVERIRSRGQVHRHLRSLQLSPEDPAADLPAAGTELAIAGKAIGTLTSVTALYLDGIKRIFSIGMVRSEAEIAKEPLRYAGGEARILSAPIKPRGMHAAEENV